MKYTAALYLCFLSLVPCTISAKPVEFILNVNSHAYDGGNVFTSKKAPVFVDQRLIEIDVSIMTAIQLDADVPDNIRKKIDKGSNSFSTGRVLLSSGGMVDLYCEEANAYALRFSGGACLRDLDNDGQFDAAYKTNTVTYQPHTLVVSHVDPDHALIAVKADLRKPIYLPTPIPYHRVGNQVIKPEKGQIRWKSDFNPDHAGPVTVELWCEGSNDYSGGWLIGPSKQVVLNGSPVEINMYGLIITILNVDSHGDLSYKLFGQIDSMPVRFAHEDFEIPTTTYYYYVPRSR